MLLCQTYIFFERLTVSIAHFFIGWLVFLSLSFENSLYILDTSSLTDMGYINIFPQSVAFHSLNNAMKAFLIKALRSRLMTSFLLCRVFLLVTKFGIFIGCCGLCLNVLNLYIIKRSESKDDIYLMAKSVLSLRESSKSEAKKALVDVNGRCTLFHPACKLKDLVLSHLT